MTERCEHCGELPGITFLLRWMFAENPLLGGVTPIDMLEAGRGAKLAIFIRDAYLNSAAVDSDAVP